MIRKILIDCNVGQGEDTVYDYGNINVIRAAAYRMQFTATLFVDGRKALVKQFDSRYTDQDAEDEDRLAQTIIQNFYSARPVGVYDVHNPPEAVGDELFIEFSPYAKEIFEFLNKHKVKLLEAFNGK